MFEPHRAETRQFALVAREIDAELARPVENELDVRQLAIAPSHHAPKKPQPIDQLRVDSTGITQLDQVNSDRSVTE